jgi:hypothetical protein
MESDPQKQDSRLWGWASVDVGHSIQLIPEQPGHDYDALEPTRLCKCGPLVRWEGGRMFVVHQPWN